LLSGGKTKVDINIWRLITKNEVIIKSIALNNITAKIKRQLPDTSFNFQFIVDAFAPADTTTKSSADSSSSVNISRYNILLHRKTNLTGTKFRCPDVSIISFIDCLLKQISHQPIIEVFKKDKPGVQGMVTGLNEEEIPILKKTM
jgi:hypothetical protein